VRQGAVGTLPLFIEAARELEADGVDGITTGCGFLAAMQDEIAAAVNVPVATSSLMQVDLVNRLLAPGKRTGVLTISGSSLTPAILEKARVPQGTPIGTTEDGAEFTRAVLGSENELDVALARKDNVDAALDLQARNPDLGALVLECTNMVPYASGIREATGLPTFTIESFVSWFQSGLSPRCYPSP